MDSNNDNAIIDFRDNLLNAVTTESTINGTDDIEEFVSNVVDRIVEAEELSDFNYLPHESTGARNKQIQIDGYAYNELDDSLDIVIAIPIKYGTVETLTVTEMNKYFGRATAFLENAEFILEKGEESAPGYGLAYDIVHRYSTVQKYKIFLITEKKLSQKVSKIDKKKVCGIETEFFVWDINRLYTQEMSQTAKVDLVINLKDYGINGIACMEANSNSEYAAYLCNIPGIVLANLYNEYGGRLLEGNVRSFLQVKGKVNKGIRVTILNKPEMFFAYNNGIAATAFDIKTEVKNGTTYITEITGLQIVNGGQTTASLATALLKDKKDNAEEKIKKIYVPMKLSIVTPDNANELIANIARFANSQNKVSDADLWSNHPFHIRMEEISRRILAPATGGRTYGTYWYYERANGQYKQETYKFSPAKKKNFEKAHPKNQKFTKTDLAKFMQIEQMRPDIASAGGQKAFAQFADWVVKEWEKHETDFNDDFFQRVIAVVILFKSADYIVRTAPWYNSYKANIVAYTLSKIFYEVETKYKDCSINYKNIWVKQDLSDAWKNQIAVIAHQIHMHLTDINRPVENVTEWAKRKECWEKAKDISCVLNPAFIAELQNKSQARAEAGEARRKQKAYDTLKPTIEVVNFGQDGWNELLSWNAVHNVLLPSELNLIKKAAIFDGGLITSDRNCQRVIKLLEKCREEGFPK